jgi:hypothetical protein
MMGEIALQASNQRRARRGFIQSVLHVYRENRQQHRRLKESCVGFEMERKLKMQQGEHNHKAANVTHAAHPERLKELVENHRKMAKQRRIDAYTLHDAIEQNDFQRALLLEADPAELQQRQRRL